MDYDVSSKREQRGILAGMLLGVARRDDRNFFIEHSPFRADYLLFKKVLLEKIARKPVSLRQRKTRSGDRVLRIQPKLIPLSRVLVKQLYRGNQRTITQKFLNCLTPQGIAIWFADKGAKSYKKKAGKIHALEIVLNTHLSQEANEIIVSYFSQVWGVDWGLSKSKTGYRLRLGTQAGKAFLAFLQPYTHPSMGDKLQTSYNINGHHLRI